MTQMTVNLEEYRDLIAERDRLRAALRRYGRHEDDCDLTRRGAINGGACDCGWRTIETEESL